MQKTVYFPSSRGYDILRSHNSLNRKQESILKILYLSTNFSYFFLQLILKTLSSSGDHITGRLMPV